MQPAPLRAALALLLVSVCWLEAPSAEAAIRCVKPGGGSGCFATISAGLAAASPGDTVRVAAGTYVEYVVINQNVTVEGGWNASFTARDPAASPTTIMPPDATTSVVSITGNFADPSISTPVLDGFTITGGGGGNHGGGIRIQDSNATVRNCVITGNRGFLFGGGVWIQRGNPLLENDRIENNVVSDASTGGGVSVEGPAQVTFVDDVIDGNSIAGGAGSGGGIYADAQSTLTIRGGTISGNSAGPACSGSGGGIYSAGASLEIRSAKVIGNCAASYDALVAGTATQISDSLFVSRPPSTAASMMRVASVFSDSSLQGSTFVSEISGDPRTIELVDSLGEAPYVQVSLIDDLFVAVSTVAIEFAFPSGGSNVFFGGGLPSGGAVDYVVEDPLLDASYHLTHGSPLVDAGARRSGSLRDIDGDVRPADGGSGRFRSDIGADELRGPAQRLVDVDDESADLTVIGPGNPPENPASTGTSDWIGYSVLAADVDGDGGDDLVFSARDWAEDKAARDATGRVFGFRHFGTRRTGVLDMRSEPADFEAVCRLPQQHLGETLVAGDLDGDGTRDLVMGSTDSGNGVAVPTVSVLFGGSPLTSGATTIDVGSLGDFAVRAPDADSGAFATEGGLATGDLDGDGIDDLVVADRLADDGAMTGVGAVYVFFGDSTLHGVRFLDTGSADLTVYGPATVDPSFAGGPPSDDPFSHAYYGGIALGDVNHDGHLDLVMRDATRAYALFGPLAPGTKHLATQSVDLFVQGLRAGGVFVMDLTGDGIDDLLLDSQGPPVPPYPSRSSLYVIPGPIAAGAIPSAASAAAVALTHDSTFGSPARAFARGDVAGDPRPELLVALPQDDDYDWVFAVSPGPWGPGEVPLSEAASVVIQSGGGLFDVAAGDLDGDGRADLVTERWQQPDGAAPQYHDDVGNVLVFYGDACGNGLLNAGEACDDAKPADGDGCSFDCRIETDYACVGAPSACGFDVAKLAVSSVVGATTAQLGRSVAAGASVTSALALAHDGLALELWLSRDGSFDAAQDREVGGCTLPLLASGLTQACVGNPVVPANLPLVGGTPTQYRWFACVATAAGRSCALGNAVTVPEPSGAALAALAALAGLGRGAVSRDRT